MKLHKVRICKLLIVTPKYIYIIAHPAFIVCSFMENSIGLKRVIKLFLVWLRLRSYLSPIARCHITPYQTFMFLDVGRILTT